MKDNRFIRKYYDDEKKLHKEDGPAHIESYGNYCDYRWYNHGIIICSLYTRTNINRNEILYFPEDKFCLGENFEVAYQKCQDYFKTFIKLKAFI